MGHVSNNKINNYKLTKNQYNIIKISLKDSKAQSISKLKVKDKESQNNSDKIKDMKTTHIHTHRETEIEKERAGERERSKYNTLHELRVPPSGTMQMALLRAASL